MNEVQISLDDLPIVVETILDQHQNGKNSKSLKVKTCLLTHTVAYTITVNNQTVIIMYATSLEEAVEAYNGAFEKWCDFLKK